MRRPQRREVVMGDWYTASKRIRRCIVWQWWWVGFIPEWKDGGDGCKLENHAMLETQGTTVLHSQGCRTLVWLYHCIILFMRKVKAMPKTQRYKPVFSVVDVEMLGPISHVYHQSLASE